MGQGQFLFTAFRLIVPIFDFYLEKDCPYVIVFPLAFRNVFYLRPILPVGLHPCFERDNKSGEIFVCIKQKRNRIAKATIMADWICGCGVRKSWPRRDTLSLFKSHQIPSFFENPKQIWILAVIFRKNRNFGKFPEITFLKYASIWL